MNPPEDMPIICQPAAQRAVASPSEPADPGPGGAMLAATEEIAEKVVEKKMKAGQAITQLAALYQPIDVVNTTPPTDNALKYMRPDCCHRWAYCLRGNTYGPGELQMSHFLQ